jgi:WD repeat-containing protein 19
MNSIVSVSGVLLSCFRYKEAVEAYEAARDYDNAVRLHLDKLNDPENAVRIVKLTKR